MPHVRRSSDTPRFARRGVDGTSIPGTAALPPDTTFEQVKGFGLTAGKLVFAGDFTEVWDQAKSNIRDVRQVL